ncbi:hypothetical protein RM190_18020 [Paracoccus sp. CPCC 101403]|uniref:DUF2442 domain-containing protein n=1 Tax=Paracoccus broussonetiae TaxID=3075834 RepID=A0ABU3EHP1_9RHOB|nr:hypothetical protein [Paracoccus sp. CPCC 101403]
MNVMVDIQENRCVRIVFSNGIQTVIDGLDFSAAAQAELFEDAVNISQGAAPISLSVSVGPMQSTVVNTYTNPTAECNDGSGGSPPVSGASNAQFQDVHAVG